MEILFSTNAAKEDQGEFSYGPENLNNNDWKGKRSLRAWSEGAAGDGVGEYVELKLNKPAPLSMINIRNGYCSDETLHAANNRIKTLTVTLNGEHSFDAELDGENLYSQKVRVFDYNKPVSTVKLTIKGVYRGNKYNDTCITSISLGSRLAKEPKTYGSR